MLEDDDEVEEEEDDEDEVEDDEDVEEEDDDEGEDVEDVEDEEVEANDGGGLGDEGDEIDLDGGGLLLDVEIGVGTLRRDEDKCGNIKESLGTERVEDAHQVSAGMLKVSTPNVSGRLEG